MNIEQKIEEVLNTLRPYLMNDGGNVELVKYENGKVYIKMLGACSNCSLIDFTIKDGIEVMLINEIPEITEVIHIEEI